jgi:hypothetical protein
MHIPFLWPFIPRHKLQKQEANPVYMENITWETYPYMKEFSIFSILECDETEIASVI